MNREKWRDCKACPLHKTRRNVVLGRGAVPCDILFIGEAPGKVEDLHGEPFIGPSGKMLDFMMEAAAQCSGVPAPSYYITNTCACRPTDSLSGPNLKPTPEQLAACHERLVEEITAASPKRVVLVGKVAQKTCGKQVKGAHKMHHPAFLLRTGGAKSPYYLREMRNLSIVFEEVYHGKAQAKSIKRKKRRLRSQGRRRDE